MSFIASIPEIDLHPKAVFILHEKTEKIISIPALQKGQLGYVEGGNAQLTLSGETHLIPVRHFFWIPKHHACSIRMGSATTILRSIFYDNYEEIAGDFYSQWSINPASELLIQMIAHTAKWNGQHVSSTHLYFDFCTALIKLASEHLQQSLSFTLPTTQDERLLQIIKYLEKNISEPLSLKLLSEQFSISERTVSRMFQTHLKLTFLQYLTTLRIIKAIDLLQKTNITISDIAYQVGYDSIGSFSNTFYAFTRYRPSELRKKRQE